MKEKRIRGARGGAGRDTTIGPLPSAGYSTVRAVGVPTFGDFDGRSFRQIFQVPYIGSCLVRARYETDNTAGGTITNVAFAAGRNISDDNPINDAGSASTWTVASAVTVTAASASFSTDGTYGSGVTSWVSLTVPTPTDSGVGGYVYVGTRAASAPRRGIIGSASRPTSDWEITINSILSRQKYRAFYNSGADNVSANQNAFTNASGASYFNPCIGLDVIPPANCFALAFFGDSTTQGFGTGTPSVAPQSYSWAHVAAGHAQAVQMPIVSANYGAEGKSQVFYLQRLSLLLEDAAWSPSVVVIQPFSTNAGFTEGVISAGIDLAISLANSCVARGIKVILTTVPPNSSTSAATDAARAVGNGVIKTRWPYVLDISQIVGDSSSTQRIQASYTFDGTHFTRAGNEVIGAALRAMLPAV